MNRRIHTHLRTPMTGPVVLLSVLTLTATILLSSPPSCAWACSPVGENPQILLGFHERYGSVTHCGVDLEAGSSQNVVTPVSGTVSFLGDVPASDSSEGRTMEAVSITLDDGRVLTLMPFSRTCVEQGDVVEEGETIGTLAPSGDRSSNASHLHIGLKERGSYLDPSGLLGIQAEGDPDGEGTSDEEVIASDEGWLEDSAVTIDGEGATSDSDPVVDLAVQCDAPVVDVPAVSDVLSSSAAAELAMVEGQVTSGGRSLVSQGGSSSLRGNEDLNDALTGGLADLPAAVGDKIIGAIADIREMIGDLPVIRYILGVAAVLAVAAGIRVVRRRAKVRSIGRSRAFGQVDVREGNRSAEMGSRSCARVHLRSRVSDKVTTVT